MLIIKIIGVILFSMAISLVVTGVYIKILSVLKKRYGESIRKVKLLQKICNPSGNSGQDSKWEVYSIQYFDNVYNFLNTNILRIVRILRDIWRNKKNYYTYKRYNENPNRNLKSFLPATPHIFTLFILLCILVAVIVMPFSLSLFVSLVVIAVVIGTWSVVKLASSGKENSYDCYHSKQNEHCNEAVNASLIHAKRIISRIKKAVQPNANKTQSRDEPLGVRNVVTALEREVGSPCKETPQRNGCDWIKFTGVDAYHDIRLVDNLV